MKLSVLLGIKESAEKVFKDCLADIGKKFSNNQGIFRGERKSHTPVDGYLEEPSKIGNTAVQSTIDEQFRWMEKANKDFLETVFSIEKTNASGNVKAELIVNGESWGIYSSLELLRLKTTLDNPALKEIYKAIPVRSQSDTWVKSEDPEYDKRAVFETAIEKGITRTTEKRKYILHDPHADKNRAPVEGMEEKQVQTGTTTHQKFSGEYSMFERASIIARYEDLKRAVTIALETANCVETEKSDLGVKALAYLNSKV